MGNLPDLQCLDKTPHEAHEWNSLSHRWQCDGVPDNLFTTILDDVHGERIRAHLKHGPNSMESGPWNDPNGRRLRILLEEVGEVAREFNDAEIESRDVDADKLFKELVQVAAMSTAWADATKRAIKMRRSGSYGKS